MTKHDWVVLSSRDMVERRVCGNCGAKQELTDCGEWMRVKMLWKPNAGRCKLKKLSESTLMLLAFRKPAAAPEVRK